MDRRRNDSGSLVVELVVLTPVLFAFVVGATTFGRLSEARQEVVEAARAGAQDGAVSPTAAGAVWLATLSPYVGTSNWSRACANVSVAVDTGHFYPGGYIAVTVTCQINLADVSFPGVPGTTTIKASMTAPVDPYSEIQ